MNRLSLNTLALALGCASLIAHAADKSVASVPKPAAGKPAAAQKPDEESRLAARKSLISRLSQSGIRMMGQDRSRPPAVPLFGIFEKCQMLFPELRETGILEIT